MEHKSISKWINIYAVIMSVIFLAFAVLAISGRGYATLERSGEALHAVVSLGIRYIVVALILVLGMLHRNRGMLLAGFFGVFVITLGDFVASVIITSPPIAQVLITTVVSNIVVWIPSALCIRVLMKRG